MLILSAASPAITGDSTSDPDDDNLPAADTTVPTFISFGRTPQWPGPANPVQVTTRVADESDNLTMNVMYGYDNSSWSSVTGAKSAVYTQTLTDRNPSSGTIRGTLTKTYSPNSEVTYLNVRIYSSDHDSCWLRVRGYRLSTSTWVNLYYSTSTGDGTKVNMNLKGQGYTAWDIYFYDREGDDYTYYNCTYKVGHQDYTASIPKAGANPKVYYYYTMTDPDANSATSSVFNYTIDSTAPVILNFTKLTGMRRAAASIPVYANVSDGRGLGDTYINWTVDNSTYHLVPMSVVSGNSTAAKYLGQLPAPSTNTTVWYRIDAYDAGGNHNNSTWWSVQWNPPPEITGLGTTPVNPNQLVTVNISCTVTDADGLSTVKIRYSTDGSTWTDGTVNSSGSTYSTVMQAALGNPWVYYKVWANDTQGGVNETSVQKYYVDRTKPRIHTPTYHPEYPNASSPVWVCVNVTDKVGIASARIQYSLDGGTTWSNASMAKPSNVSALSVGGYVRPTNLAYLNGIKAVGELLGTWSSSVSGHGGTPSATLFTSVDVVILDGAGSSWYSTQAISTAREGKLVIVSSSTWNSVRSALGYPSYTSHVSNGFTTYGLKVGRGAVVMTNSLTSNNYIGSSYSGYNATSQAGLAEHLKGVHVVFVPYSGQIPATVTSKRVIYKINATDLSNLSVTSSTYEYTTDGSPPTFVAVKMPPSLAGWSQTSTFSVWADVRDDNYLGGVTLHYSLNGGSSWSSVTLTRASGNETAANYTGTIPASVSSNWVNYYYVTHDRSYNDARYPTTGILAYQTSDAPYISGLTHSPTIGGKTTPVRVTATITDPDVIGFAEVYYRVGSGAWTQMNATSGTNDRWYADIPSPGVTARVYFYFHARDTIGVWSTSSTSSYLIDGTDPMAKVTGRSVQYPNATQTVQVNGSISDDRTGVGGKFQYKLGESGTVADLASTVDHTDQTYYVRNPTYGYTYGTLSATYYMTAELSTLRVYVYTSDYDTLWVRIRGYKASTSSWVNLYASTSTGRGTKIDTDFYGSGYTRWDIYMYDTEGDDRIYYSANYRDYSDKVTANVTGPGYSTLVFYRLVGFDAAGNTNTSEWYSYWADGTLPTLGSHTTPGTRYAQMAVTLDATFVDEHAIASAKVFYTMGGAYRNVTFTTSTSNETHLTAKVDVPATLIPMSVTYYFVIYDRAGNVNSTSTFNYSTVLSTMNEGATRTYDANRLESAVGYKGWQWDFDYTGTFSADASGVSVSHQYMDDGKYTIALRLTDNNDAVTTVTFDQRVLDRGPTAKIVNPGIVDEGENITLDGTGSLSWPDAIASYEWDLDYDGAGFDVDSNASSLNHVFLDNGTYTIALRTTDDDGTIDIVALTVAVRDLSPTIVIDFPSTVDEGVNFTLNATGTWSWPDAIVRLDWDMDWQGAFAVDATGDMVNHTYMDDRRYTFIMRAYDEDGSFSTHVGRVTVRDLGPTANITALSVVDEGTVLVLDASASESFPDDIVLYQWDFLYDGTFNVDGSGVQVNHTYMDQGNYTIALRVRDDDGSVGIVTMVIFVRDRAPTPVIVGPVIIPEGEEFHLNGTNSTSYPDAITTMEWDLDYNGSSFDRDFFGDYLDHTYMDDGNYTIALRVTDEDGSAVITTLVITVTDRRPYASFQVLGVLEEGVELRFDGRASASYPDPIVSWEWEVARDGDGNYTSNYEGEMVQHTFMDDGVYLITLRVTDEDGSVSEMVQSVTIADLGPTAKLLEDGVNLPPRPEGIALELNGSTYSNSWPDMLVSYEWWWDADGTFQSGDGNITLLCTFLSPGEHTVWMRVTDDDGSQDETNITVVVLDVAPQAFAFCEPTPEGDPVYLNATNSTEPGNDFVAFRWDLDADGEWDEVTTDPHLVKTWYAPGLFQIRLEVEDEDGSMDTFVTLVRVIDVAPTAVGGGPYEVDEGETLHLDGTGSHEPGGNIVAYRWDLDNDALWDRDNLDGIAQWSWAIAGLHKVTLQVEDAEGNTHSVLINVTVHDLMPDFTLEMPGTLEEGQLSTFALRDLKDPGTDRFQVTWYFGDGEEADGEQVTKRYLEQGSYDAYVTILDNDGIVHRWNLTSPVLVGNADPVIEMDLKYYKAVEDEQFILQVEASDTVMDTLTFQVDGPGGRIDENTGVFTWTPLDQHVGERTFTIIVKDEDGGKSQVEITINVEDVDNDFLGGMSNAGGSAILVLLVMVVILISVLYMRNRGGDTDLEMVEPGQEAAEQPTVVLDPTEAAPVVAPAVTGAEVTHEADAGESAQIPPPPPPGPEVSGPEFNQLLEDRASESEVSVDEETEMDWDSEWEILE